MFKRLKATINSKQKNCSKEKKTAPHMPHQVLCSNEIVYFDLQYKMTLSANIKSSLDPGRSLFALHKSNRHKKLLYAKYNIIQDEDESGAEQ